MLVAALHLGGKLGNLCVHCEYCSHACWCTSIAELHSISEKLKQGSRHHMQCSRVHGSEGLRTVDLMHFPFVISIFYHFYLELFHINTYVSSYFFFF